MTDMTFYKFEIDDDRFGSNYGYAPSDPLQFPSMPSDIVIYLDRDTNEWTASSDEQQFAPQDDIEDLMSDIATAYGADSWDVDDEDEIDDGIDDLQVASFRISNYSHESALLDSIKYGIDIDVDSMTAVGQRSRIASWKRARMKTTDVMPGWKMIDFDLYELQNGLEDTYVSRENDGMFHLFSNGLDMGSFSDADTAMQNAEEVLDHQDMNDFDGSWWPLGVDQSGDEVKTAGVWKLDIDRPLTISEKKTFLDNNIDVNENEEEDGTNVLTMTGSDKAVADTAELLELTSDFVQDAYHPDISLSDVIDDSDAQDYDVPDEMSEEIQDDIDEDEELHAPEDEDKDKIIDGVIDLLDSWKDDMSDREASRTATRSVCPICLTTVDDDDMEHCDMADMDMCPDCCKWMCEGEDNKSDKTAAHTTNYAFPWGAEDGGWYYNYYVGEPGNYDNSYSFDLHEDGDGWSFEVGYPMSTYAYYQSEVYPDRESCENAAADFEYEHCQTVYDYEADDLTGFRNAAVTADSHGPDCNCEDEDDDEDKTACEASVKTSVKHLLDDTVVMYDDNEHDDTGISVTRVDDDTIEVEAEDEDAYEFWLRQHGIDNGADVELYDEDPRLASVKKAHSSNIQMMLGDTGYYWHLEVRDDAGNIIKEGDYASEELASKAADSMTGRENDVPVADVDGIVYDEDGGIMDDTADYDDWYDDWYDDCSDDCLEDDFEVYADDDSVVYPDDYDAYANAEE